MFEMVKKLENWICKQKTSLITVVLFFLKYFEVIITKNVSLFFLSYILYASVPPFLSSTYLFSVSFGV